MVTQTPRFSLDKYSQGEDNWSHSDTVDLLDEKAVEIDTVSNRPGTGDYNRELFYATDDEVLYSWDSNNSEWDDFAYGKNSTPTWTGEHTFNAGIEIPEGQAIEDGAGNKRFSIESFASQIYNDDQEIVFAAQQQTKLFAHTDTNIVFRDKEGDFTALEYTASSTKPGTLELTNADLDLGGHTIDYVDNINGLSGEALNIGVRGTGGSELQIFGDGPVALANGANLEIPEGQEIQDDNGQRRFRITDGGTRITSDTSGVIEFEDGNGGFIPLKYQTSGSRPGTLELTNAELDANSNDVTGVASLEADDSVSKVRNDEVVYAGHPDFSSPQDADTFAANNGYHVVEIPQGNYGQLKPSSNIKIVGLPPAVAGPSGEQSLFAPGGAPAIEIENNRSVIESVVVDGGTPGSGDPHHGILIDAITFARIENCLINKADGVGIRCDGSRVRLLGNHFRTSDIDGEEVLLTSNSSRCVVDGSSSQSGVTVTNNGTNNVIGDNA